MLPHRLPLLAACNMLRLLRGFWQLLGACQQLRAHAHEQRAQVVAPAAATHSSG